MRSRMRSRADLYGYLFRNDGFGAAECAAQANRPRRMTDPMNGPCTEGQRLLVKNVQIFDRFRTLVRGHVVIEGHTIAAWMIDAHVHLVGMANTLIDLALASQSQLAAATLVRAKDTLLRGFTTVRDMAETPRGSRR